MFSGLPIGVLNESWRDIDADDLIATFSEVNSDPTVTAAKVEDVCRWFDVEEGNNVFNLCWGAFESLLREHYRAPYFPELIVFVPWFAIFHCIISFGLYGTSGSGRIYGIPY